MQAMNRPATIFYHSFEKIAYRRLYWLLALWLRRIHTRAVLRALDPHQLYDIGLSEKERDRECAKWWWEE